MSTAQFGAIANGKKGDNWAFVDGSGSYSNPSILKIPSGGYYTFYTDTNRLSKVSDNGRLVWQKTISGFGAQMRLYKLLSNGDILAAGYVQGFYAKGAIARFNPESGTFSWVKHFIMGYQIELFTARINADDAGNYVYIYHTRKIAGDPNTQPTYPTLSKISLSDASVQWTREIVAAGGLRAYTADLVVDSSGNAYLGGTYTQSVDSEYRGFLIKYNSSGTALWQRQFTRTNIGPYTDYFWVETVGIDSSNNIHLPCIYRYDVGPVYGNAMYYAKVNSSGTILNQYSILPNPVPSINFPTYLNAINYCVTDSNDDAYFYAYGQFNYEVSTQQGATLVKISNGNSLSYLSNFYIGSSMTEGFSGPGGFAIDGESNRLALGVYRFTGGPENVILNIPTDGSASGARVSPKAFQITYRDETPAALGTPPVTFSTGSLTLRSATESYIWEDISTPTVTNVSAEQYVHRF